MFIEEYPYARREEEEWSSYDPACERVDVAIRAIWLLYRRARWALLEDLLGMPRRDLEKLFGQFDMQYIASDHGRIRSESQVFALLRMFNQSVEVEVKINRHKSVKKTRRINPLLGAAMQMVVDYQWIYRKARGGKHGPSVSGRS